MTLYEKILSKFLLWKKTEHMILLRKHAYLNDERICIDNTSMVAGCRVITFHKNTDDDRQYMYYAPHKHFLITKNPEGKLAKTIVYTGKLLRPIVFSIKNPKS